MKNSTADTVFNQIRNQAYETSGRLIFRSEVQNNEEKIELPNKGIYFIRIGSENIKIAL